MIYNINSAQKSNYQEEQCMKEKINNEKNIMQEKVLIWEASRRISVEKQKILEKLFP